MLKHPTYDKLFAMKLTGMAAALQEQSASHSAQEMTFEERLGLLVDREMTERTNRLIAIRLRISKLRQSACVEDIDFRHTRGLDRSLVMSLSSCDWIRRHDNCLLTGPTGVGKTFLACALANKACREGCKVTYERTSRLLESLAMARADGSYARKLAGIARYDLLVLDDWGLAALTLEQCRDLLEVFEDRYDRRSTLVTSQVPVADWHKLMPDPTLADAVLDRLVHNAHRVALTGESMRKTRPNRLVDPDSRPTATANENN
jgi:DNA replication protein DnaC